MLQLNKEENLQHFVENLTFAEKIDRSLDIIEKAYKEYGDSLVMANSLGKDSSVAWHLCKRVNKKMRGFIVTTRYKPKETVQFMHEQTSKFPELMVFKNDEEIPDGLYESDPDTCCEILKVRPTRWAIEKMNVNCWVTGLRCTEGRTRNDFKEIEELDEGLIKLNPILVWTEREVWQYIALFKVDVNPLYARGFRSLGCEPCTLISAHTDERAGRWVGTSKCGGECGIHTRPLKANPNR